MKLQSILIRRVISSEKGKAFADKYDTQFIEVSAKSSSHINDVITK